MLAARAVQRLRTTTTTAARSGALSLARRTAPVGLRALVGRPMTTASAAAAAPVTPAKEAKRLALVAKRKARDEANAASPTYQSPNAKKLAEKTAILNELAERSDYPYVGKPEVFDLSLQGQRSLFLNRPKALNALNIDMIRRLTAHLLGYEKNPMQYATVLLSASSKAFCAGGDVKTLCEYVQRKRRGLNKPDEEDPTDAFFREEYRLNFLTSIVSKPLIPIMNGITMGGGVGLSVHAPYTVATEKTVFAMPETAIGFIPDVGASHVLSRLPLQGMGMFLALTGFRLKGADVLHAGIASHYMPSSSINPFCTRLGDAEGQSREHVEMTLETHCVEPTDDGLGFGLEPHLDVIAECFGDDVESVEDVLDRLKRVASDAAHKPAQREFAQLLVTALAGMSPTALKVTFEQLRRGHAMSLEDCLKMEFRIVQHMLTAGPTDEFDGKPPSDFVAGVDAKLIRKSREPVQWNPPTLAEVTPAMVESYFAPTPLGVDELELPTEAEVHEQVYERAAFHKYNMKVYEPVGDAAPQHVRELNAAKETVKNAKIQKGAARAAAARAASASATSSSAAAAAADK